MPKIATRTPLPPKKRSEPQDSNRLLWVRSLAGPGIIIGGWQLMPTSYVVGTVIVYFGFSLCLLECIKEPALVGHLRWRVALVVVVLIFAAVFSFRVVFISAPLGFDSYAMRKGDYSPGTVIAGIPWNSHFTDLRVWIKNPTDNDYRDVDLAVQPDQWNYKAAILEENTGCQLISLGGNSLLVAPNGKGGATSMTAHYEGNHFEAGDDAGDVFEHLITQGGYRLICPKLPAHFAIQIVFALAAASPDLGVQNTNLKPNEWAGAFYEIKPTDKFNILSPRPSPSVVTIIGRYGRELKNFSLNTNIRVLDGN
jgi:hypothetical protein